MTKVKLLQQISLFIKESDFTSVDNDNYLFMSEMTEQLRAMMSDWEDEGILLDIKDSVTQALPDAKDTVIGTLYKISISLVNLRQDGICIYSDWDSFFCDSKNQIHVPDCFYLISDDVLFIGDIKSSSGELKHYINTVALIDTLVEMADHVENVSNGNAPNVVMLHKKRLEIPCQYTSNDIKSGLDGITHITNWLQGKEHKDQKINIFKTALYDFLKSVKKSKRFEYLLIQFGEFSSQVIENYELYVSEFSFDDVRLEYQEKKRDYMLKIDDIFSSIQTKALGIPVSIAFIAMRLSSTKITENSPSIDFLLFIATCVYGLMMFLLINNQKHSLRSIEAEYKGQICRLKKEYPEQHEKIKSEFKELDRRCKFQRFQLNLFLLLLMGLIILGMQYLEFDFTSIYFLKYV
ncbi:hypothetical protein ACPV36_04870 [Photobacterium damselae]|uniref:hypothetical protein n=1 Tax=Photobacterium damselae TaxID=38293 RepID=UPI0040689424